MAPSSARNAPTSAFRVNWRDSVLYSMPRPLNELRSSTIVTSRSVRTRETVSHDVQEAGGHSRLGALGHGFAHQHHVVIEKDLLAVA